MSKEVYIGNSSVARKVSDMYIGVNNVARKIVQGYIGVNGVARLFYDITQYTESSNVYAMLYSDGHMQFQVGDKQDLNRTLVNSWNGFINDNSIPWSTVIKNIKTFNVANNVSPTNISRWFNGAGNLISVPYCGSNVTNMVGAYDGCINLTGAPVCGKKVTDMSMAYYNCWNLTGSPVCGINVTDMYLTYFECFNLTGFPMCGPNVTNMSGVYYDCSNLTGSPVCGNNVINMSQAYFGCTNLTGSPVCGTNVNDMNSAYLSCTNLTGPPVCGPNVTNMYGTYIGCPNSVQGTSYFYSPNVENALRCFYGKNNSLRFNVHVPVNSTTLNTFLISNSKSIVGANITWTNTDSYYYNTAYNIYIYPNSSL